MGRIGWCLVVVAFWIKASNAAYNFNKAERIDDHVWDEAKDAGFVFNNGKLYYGTDTGSMSIFDPISKQWSSSKFNLITTDDVKYKYFSLRSTLFVAWIPKRPMEGGLVNLKLQRWDDASGQFFTFNLVADPMNFHFETQFLGGKPPSDVTSSAYMYITAAVPDPTSNIAYLAISAATDEMGSDIRFLKLQVDFESGTATAVEIDRAQPQYDGSKTYINIVSMAAVDNSLYAFKQYWPLNDEGEEAGYWDLDVTSTRVINLDNNGGIDVSPVGGKSMMDPSGDSFFIKNQIFTFARDNDGVKLWSFDTWLREWNASSFVYPIDSKNYYVYAFDPTSNNLYMKGPDSGLYEAKAEKVA